MLLTSLMLGQKHMWRFTINAFGALLFHFFWLSAFAVAQEAPADAAAEVNEGDAAAQPEGGGEGLTAPSPGAIYIPFKPSFVVNYGGPGRLKYIKADISVRLEDAKAANSVRHHMPYIRNNLVLLLSAQTEESISSQEGKEALRQEALKEVRSVIMAEDGQEGVVDLFFNAFLIQK